MMIFSFSTAFIIYIVLSQARKEANFQKIKQIIVLFVENSESTVIINESISCYNINKIVF